MENILSSLEAVIPTPWQRIVAVEIDEDDSLELFQRTEDGQGTVSLRLPYRWWLLTAGPEMARALDMPCDLEPLQGEGTHRCRVRLESRKAYEEALKKLKALTGQPPSSPLAPYRTFSHATQQAMIDQGIRLFRGMSFPQLRRMQLDIECTSSIPGRFCNAKVAGDEVIMVALKDTRGFERCLTSQECGGEAGLLREMLRVIQERDPDVLEGHNLFAFDLCYLQERCKRHKIPFALGRGGKVAKSHPSRMTIAEQILNFPRFDIYGRHVVDTYHLVRLYDVSRRELESYRLKYCAKHFGLAREGRVYVPGEEITRLYQEDPARLAEYNLDDVRETEGLSNLLSPSYFYQTQLIPASYQDCILRGNAARIDAMLCAAYLSRGHALPSPQAPQAFEGALTTVENMGVFRPAWHLDVRSLYPSVLLAAGASPASDSLGLFIQLLGHLRAFRLQAKDAARTASTPARKKEYQALQNSFKILINSFYGYLGFPQGTFNDYRLAERVTSTGRQILTKMRDDLEKEQAKILEMDTDGIYFTPPPASTPEQMRERIQKELPPGIEVELDGLYAAMFSYKSKNYALLEQDGSISLHGAALRSRGLEPFLQRFIRQALQAILLEDTHDLAPLTSQYLEEMQRHAWPLGDFLRKENLTQTLENYDRSLASGKGKRSAVYELVRRSSKAYAPGDAVRYYVTGTKKSVSVTDNSKLEEEIDEQNRDENLSFYADRLQSLAKKLQAVL